MKLFSFAADLDEGNADHKPSKQTKGDHVDEGDNGHAIDSDIGKKKKCMTLSNTVAKPNKKNRPSQSSEIQKKVGKLLKVNDKLDTQIEKKGDNVPSEFQDESTENNYTQNGMTGSAASFEELGVSNWLQKQCSEMGCVRPTAIQSACIGPILAGRDCIGAAPTGSGKTAAFALPILQRLSRDPYGIFCLVLTPTRELAFQIADQFNVFGQPINVSVAIIVGGLDMTKQAAELAQRPHVVVSTPGRLADHLRSSADVTLSRVGVLVLDEADRLLSETFSDDLNFILGALPNQRQTLLFSATMSGCMNLTKTMALSTPFVFNAQPRAATVDQLDQRYVFVPAQVKDAYAAKLLEDAAEGQVIVFTATCRACQELTLMLEQLGHRCASLHSKLSQNDRLISLQRFRACKRDVLVATDVASRGLDIPTVTTVLNFDVPQNPDDYIHRVGRTARAGRGGVAITIVTQYDVERVHVIEEKIGKPLTLHDIDESDVLKSLNAVAKTRRTALLAMAEKDWGSKDRINKEKRKMLEAMSAEPRTKKKKKSAKRHAGG